MKSRKFSLLGILIFLSTVSVSEAKADIELNTTVIESDTVWNYTGGKYFLKGDVLIRSGATLTIAPGVEIDATQGEFTVRGNLKIGAYYGERTKIRVGKTLIGENSLANTIIITNAEISGIRMETSTIGNGTTLISSPLNLEITNSIFRDVDTLVDCDSHPGRYTISGNSFFEVKELFSQYEGGNLSIGTNAFYELQYVQNKGDLVNKLSNSYFAFYLNYLVNVKVNFFAKLPPFSRYDDPKGGWTTSPMFKGNYFANAEKMVFTPATSVGYAIDSSVQPIQVIKSSKVEQPYMLNLYQEFDSAIEKYENERAADKAAADKAALNTRNTVTCIKGKLVKKVTAIKPTCPAGYKKK